MALTIKDFMPPEPEAVLNEVMAEIGVGSPDWKGRLVEEMERLGWDEDRVTHITVWGDPSNTTKG